MCVDRWSVLLRLVLVVAELVDTHLVVLMEVCLVELVKVVVELGLVGCFGLLTWDPGVAVVGCFGFGVEVVVQLLVISRFLGEVMKVVQMVLRCGVLVEFQ